MIVKHSKRKPGDADGGFRIPRLEGDRITLNA